MEGVWCFEIGGWLGDALWLKSKVSSIPYLKGEKNYIIVFIKIIIDIFILVNLIVEVTILIKLVLILILVCLKEIYMGPNYYFMNQ